MRQWTISIGPIQMRFPKVNSLEEDLGVVIGLLNDYYGRIEDTDLKEKAPTIYNHFNHG